MASDELRQAIAADVELGVMSRQLAAAFGEADEETLRRAFETESPDAIAAALGLSEGALEEMVNHFRLRAEELALEFPELRRLAEERSQR